ncbi:MAG TPA: hypothetical protein VEK57_03660 [Thermoanaerobaculia bacterium]|nr:hypothetical protein [Thermoanaerobaculia bacterium]
MDTGISLTRASIELLILQWYTPSPVNAANGAWIPAADEEIAYKRALLEAVAETLRARVAPTFVVIPELSLPLALLPDVEKLIDTTAKPLVVVAGLEHMSLDRYNDLHRSFDGATLPVDASSGRRINAAAVWIATDQGTRRYLQLKRGPADIELQTVMRGAESFVFRSPDQHEGRRLNFAVAICADFTNKDEVLRIRRDMGTLNDVTALDLMFVLQMNPNQNAVQFRTSVAAFFDAPVTGMAEEATLIATDKSIIVFANQARTGAKEEYGRSTIHFRFDPGALRRAGVSRTFCVEKHDGHNHLSAVFREDGPAAYLVEYVPLHRRNPGQPGSTEPPLLRRALYADLRTIAKQLEFREIEPVTHWLIDSWTRDQKLIAHEAEKNFRASAAKKEAALNSWTRACAAGIAWWKARLGDDNVARHHLGIVAGSLDASDPREWSLTTTVRLFLRNFVLVSLGTDRAFALCATPLGNVTSAGSDIAFVSGHHRWTWDTTVNEFYDGRRTALDTATKPPTVVLQETLTDVQSGTTYELPPLITEREGIDPDDITAAPRLRHIKVISGNVLYGYLCEAESHETAASVIAARIDEVLRD